ncbi:flagellar export chaperone FliS [Paenibacillus sp. GCM10027628]|uniref:flagellar export chaperone FliS n=1 Tax=Paenibacillus sp. GCM10027628 TaxID=3273413 RepID=UPI0036257CF8
MSMNMQQERYLHNTVQQASPAQLLLMLYDGAIRFCKLAVNELKKENYPAANNHLLKAQDIVRELTCTLNMEFPISENLYKLYDYFNHLLIQANVKKSEELVNEVLSYLIELKETWILASKQAQIPNRNITTR